VVFDFDYEETNIPIHPKSLKLLNQNKLLVKKNGAANFLRGCVFF